MTSWEIAVGDARKRLGEVEPGSVRTCVTSPPYWGLRDYGTGRWEGGDPACEHRHRNARPDHSGGRGVVLETRGQQAAAAAAVTPMRGTCTSCGAVRVDDQLGLEETPEEYVAELVDVLRGVREALADDGTLWLNLGDSYASKARGSDAGWDKSRLTNPGTVQKAQAASLRSTGERHRGKASGLKEKDLVGIPWMVAFALRADGWFLRADVIWSKPNPMPESVGDRPSSAHEHVFLLTKGPRYFYDAQAIAEPAVSTKPSGNTYKRRERLSINGAGQPYRWNDVGGTRNARNVWTVATRPYRGAHFATMPPELAERCILAGSAPGDLVLDPFAGAGTTGMVALRNDRRFLGLELNPEYAELARQRIRDDAPLLNQPAEAINFPDAA